MNWEALRTVYIVTGILGALEVIAFVIVAIMWYKFGSGNHVIYGRYGSPF